MATFRVPRLLSASPFISSSTSSSIFSQLWRTTTHRPPACHHQHRALLSTTRSLQKKSPQYPPKPAPPPAADIDESFLKGSGPGGQKINKTNSAVQLKHLPTGIVIKCQATRSRTQNRLIARQLLAERIDDLTKGDQSRSAIVGEAKRKKRASSAKKSRRKYRKLDEEKQGVMVDADEGDEEGFGESDEIETYPKETRKVSSRSDDSATGFNPQVEEHDHLESTRLPHETNETGKT
ncbi:RF-1 domain-containing protein [Apiospora arundinis]|uniref:RF-1 domain-containing protein n=1 Tax=Apiospora arundinis TaxID=335852 RepID=A0ABR2HZQ4_9PEZI